MKLIYNIFKIGEKVVKICGIYKITNTITGDFYIGSSNNVKRRLAAHKWPSKWNEYPNNPMYLDMQEYGIDKFVFEVLAEVEEGSLKEMEQQFIEKLKPTYNNRNAKGIDVERRKKSQKQYHKEYRKTDKNKDYQKEYQKTDKYKEHMKEYEKSDKRKEYQKEYQKEYDNQLCFYNGQTLTLSALRTRFRRRGISNPTAEAKKYLLNNIKDQ